MDEYILTKIQRPENSKLTSDHQPSTKPTWLIMYEKRGPVGTEHLSPKLHWWTSLPSRYATNRMHLSPNCKILKTLITTWDIVTVFSTAVKGVCTDGLQLLPFAHTQENNISNSSAVDIVVKSVFKTREQKHTDFCWISLLKLEAAPLQSTSRISCPVRLHSQTIEIRQLTPKRRNIFQLFPPTAHPRLSNLTQCKTHKQSHL